MGIGSLAGVANAIPGIQGFSPLPSEIGNEFMTLQTANLAIAFGFLNQVGGRLSGSLTNEEVDAIKKDPMKIQEFLKPFFDSNYNFFKKQAEEHWVDIQKHILDKAHDLELLKVEYNIRLLKELPPEYLEALAGPGPVENLQGNLGGLNDFFKKIAEILQKGPVVREPTPAPAPPSPPPVKRNKKTNNNNKTN